ncbi:hypothetical protein SCLCIDRAFT_809439 [Scleroderma citrinum Foug A]|uniref:Uncharacterized protein n=1 Tax=Scleroderma citrinum Foug A TaxID=1036808 RepID=A0A0C3A5M6_9AGAM|nr:hypothetical protein SCLCIDRAFT_809439 [Scleroderma citrinum Foug A]
MSYTTIPPFSQGFQPSFTCSKITPCLQCKGGMRHKDSSIMTSLPANTTTLSRSQISSCPKFYAKVRTVEKLRVRARCVANHLAWQGFCHPQKSTSAQKVH